MAEKLWLIRTSKKQILGPVSRQKVIELIEKSALTDKDEISRGNGYWFHLREKDLLDKYLYGDIPQEFNPISEAPDILTVGENQREGTGTIDKIPGLAKREAKAPAAAPAVTCDTSQTSEDETIIPSEDDLEYPDMGEGPGAPQKVAGEEGEEILLPASDDLDYPDMTSASVEAQPAAPLASAASAAQVAQPTKAPAPAVEEATVILNEEGEEVHLPSSDDLEYPDFGGQEGEQMTATTIEAPPVVEQEPQDELSLPSEGDLDYPDMTPEPEQMTATTIEAPPVMEEEAPAPPPVAAPVVSLQRKATPNSAVARALEQKKAPAPVAKEEVIEDDQEEEEEEEIEQDELDEVELDQEEDEFEEEDDEDDEEDDDEDDDEDHGPAPRTRRGQGVRIKRTYEAPARNDRYLFALLALVLLVLASGIIYYYSRILGKPIPFIDQVIVSSAHAQTNVQTSSSQVETSNLSKKKIFLSSHR